MRMERGTIPKKITHAVQLENGSEMLVIKGLFNDNDVKDGEIIQVHALTESEHLDDSVADSPMKQYVIREQAEEHFETGNSNENQEPMSGTPIQFQTQKTLTKQVTRKMSSKGRCRVLTVAQSLVDDTIDSINSKGDNL